MSEPYRSPAAEDDCDPPDDRKPFGYGRDRCPSCGQWRPSLAVDHATFVDAAPPLFEQSRPASLRICHAFFPLRSNCGAVWYTKLYEEREPEEPLGEKLYALAAKWVLIACTAIALGWSATVLLHLWGLLP